MKKNVSFLKLPMLNWTSFKSRLPSAKQIRLALLRYYSAPLDKQFKKLRTGFILFGAGLGTVIYANSTMVPSLSQELVFAGGLLLTGLGFLYAILMYIRFVISRFVQFCLRSKTSTPP